MVLKGLFWSFQGQMSMLNQDTMQNLQLIQVYLGHKVEDTLRGVPIHHRAQSHTLQTI